MHFDNLDQKPLLEFPLCRTAWTTLARWEWGTIRPTPGKLRGEKARSVQRVSAPEKQTRRVTPNSCSIACYSTFNQTLVKLNVSSVQLRQLSQRSADSKALWKSTEIPKPEVKIDKKAQDRSKEAPNRNQCQDMNEVGRDEGQQRDTAKQPHEPVTGEEAAYTGRCKIQHHHGNGVKMWRHVDDMLADDFSCVIAD